MSYFYVAIQADRPRPDICNLRIVQNMLCVKEVDQIIGFPTGHNQD